MSLASRGEIVAGVTGAWRLLRLDAAALGLFDFSVEGFWRSFTAALIVLPAYLVLVYLPGGHLELAGVEPLLGLLVELVNYAVRWAAYPVALMLLARPLGLGDDWVRYIIVYNWAQVVQIAIFLPAAALAAADILPGGLGRFLVLIALLGSFAYYGVIARFGLRIGWFFAGGFVVLDWVLGLTIDRLTNALLYALAAAPEGLPGG